MNLQKFGVQELSVQEQKKTQGGYWQGIAVAMFYTLMDNWGDISRSFNSGYKDYYRYK